MKKFLVVFLSLLMVFLMLPVLPNAVYAADRPAREAHATSLLDTLLPAEAQRVPGMLQMPGATRAQVDATTFVDSTLPTEGWTTIDADKDGFNWTLATEIGGGYFGSLTGSDSLCIVSASWDPDTGKPLKPDNWLVSPAIEVPENTQLQYFICGQDPEYCEEHYGVYISTTSATDTSSFTKLFEETVQSGDYEGRTVDLTDYAGKTVYIAFRHFNVTDMFFLNLDGVGLSEAGTEPVVPFVAPPIIRIKGPNRYATSIEIATELMGYAEIDEFPNAIIATGDGFADALAGSALSAVFAAPILLVSGKAPDSIDAAVSFIEDYVDSEGTVFILGGKNAVPESVEAELDEIGADYYRFAGKGRYDTNLQVLEVLAEYSDISEIIFCDGTNWPDAATASAIGLPLMLVAKDALSEDQVEFLNQFVTIDEETGEITGSSIWVDVVGGEKAVTPAIFDSLVPYDKMNDPWRLYGKSRADTAVAVADAFYNTFYNPPNYITFAYGYNFPDCIAGGLFAWAFDSPILYGSNTSPETFANAAIPYLAELSVEAVFVYGGDKLVSDDFILDTLEQAHYYTE